MTAVSDEVSFGPEVEHTARMKATSMDVPFGRPLSTIESIASSAEDEEDEEVSGSNSSAEKHANRSCAAARRCS